MNNLNKTPIVMSIIMLVLAIPPMPYGYYTLLRLVVCGTSLYLIWFAKSINRQGWMWTMGFITLLFNPIIPVHFAKAIWSLVDLVVAIIFLVGIYKLKAT